MKTNRWERSSVWLERMPVTHEVASSSLVVPAIYNKKQTVRSVFLLSYCRTHKRWGTFFQDIWSEEFCVILRHKVPKNPAFTDLIRSKVNWIEMSEMSDFGNKKVRSFAHFVHIFALYSRIDFSQPHIFLSFWRVKTRPIYYMKNKKFMESNRKISDNKVTFRPIW